MSPRTLFEQLFPKRTAGIPVTSLWCGTHDGLWVEKDCQLFGSIFYRGTTRNALQHSGMGCGVSNTGRVTLLLLAAFEISMTFIPFITLARTDTAHYSHVQKDSQTPNMILSCYMIASSCDGLWKFERHKQRNSQAKVPVQCRQQSSWRTCKVFLL